MRIVGSGNNLDLTPFNFTLAQGRAIGIATTPDHVVIECQDLTHTIYIHAPIEELERVIRFCKEKAPGVACGCKGGLPDEFAVEAEGQDFPRKGMS